MDGIAVAQDAASAPRRTLSAVLAACAFAVATLAIVGWLTETWILNRWLPRSSTTKYSSALCVLLLALVLLLVSPRAARVRAVLAILVACIATVALVEHATGLDLKIDRILQFFTTRGVVSSEPNLMPVVSALAALMLSIAVILVRSRQRRYLVVGQIVACGVFFAGLLSAVGYLYQVPVVENVRRHLTGMALPGAVTTMILAAGTLLLRPHEGLVRPLATADLIGAQSRRLLAAAIVVPLSMGWLRLVAQHRGLIGTELGLTLFATSNVATFAALVWWNARSLGAAELTRRAAEEALSAQQRQFKDFLDRAPTVMFAKNLDGNFLFANEALASKLGLGPEDFVGVHEIQITGLTAEMDVVLAQDRQVIESGLALRVERPVLGQDGKTRMYDVLRFPLVDPSGRTYGLGGIAEDITDRMQAELERAKFDEQVIQTDRLKSLGQLAGGISHDFNNLLGVILNYATLLDRQLTDPQQRADVRAIRETAERGAGLTRELMAFTRQEHMQSEAIDINELIASIIELLMRTLPPNVQVQTLLDPDVHAVIGDVRQLERVILNLALNAVDAMPDGGTFTLETTNAEFRTAPLEEANLAAGRYVRLAICDTGIGMTEEIRRHAFEPFFTTKTEGTGLGLATVYGIITQGGGAVNIYSEPGTGTTIKIYLPATEVASHSPVGNDIAPHHDGGQSGRLMVVEDEPLLRRAIERTLLDGGYEVDSFADAETALEHLLETPTLPRLIVSDVVLPGMSGVDLAIAAVDEHPQMQILLVSGYTSNMLDGFESGSRFEVLEKPFGPDSLLSRIHALLSA